MSELFAVLSQFSSPSSPEETKTQALNQLSDCCTSLRQSHQRMDKIEKEEQQECQICCVKFSEDVNLLFSSNEGKDPELLNELSRRVCTDRETRRVALSCGHNTFHQKCIKHWLQTSRKRNCPVCRTEVKNAH